MFISFLCYFQLATFLLSQPLSDDNHAIYVSVIEVTQTSMDKPGVIKIKIFTDDLEDAIYNQQGERVKLARGCAKNLNVISNYLTRHLKMRINEADVELRIKGCEKNDISHWIDFEFKSEVNWEKVEFTGDLLMELFPTQSNVFSVKFQDQKRMFRLTNSNKTTVIRFE